MKNPLYLLIISFLLSYNLHSQVGVTTYSAETDKQYTLFSQLFGNKSYLIDNCGRLINEWNPGSSNGLSSELLPNGNLVRGVKSGSSFIQQPSTGGAIEIRNWDDEQIWYYPEYGMNYIHHHDFAILPNGNIMFLGWEIISPEEQVELGRDTSKLIYPHMWGEYIKEIKPVGVDGEITWEWHLKDHFVQEVNEDLENFSVIADSPHNIDINFDHSLQFDPVDPYHANAVDFDPLRDEVVINLRSIGEFWILDHSTTIEEAATSEGGNSGLGGSILYRWGNPASYQQDEDDTDWKLYGAHGTNFVDPGLLDEGKIIVFNNGTQRPTEEYSTIEMIEPALDANGMYYLDANGQFATEEHVILYGEDKSLFSGYISNAHQTENGNIFINDGDVGRLLEVDANQNILWEYKIPISNGFPINQNSTSNSFLSFVAHRYPAGFLDDAQVDLEPGELIELNPQTDFCMLLNSQEVDLSSKIINNGYSIEISAIVNLDQLSVYSMNGKKHSCLSTWNNERTAIDISALSTGMYVLHFKDKNGAVVNYKFVVN